MPLRGLYDLNYGKLSVQHPTDLATSVQEGPRDRKQHITEIPNLKKNMVVKSGLKSNMPFLMFLKRISYT